MELKNIQYTNDGKQVDKKFVETWNISDYCDVYNRVITISFVGVIVFKERVLFSFPKHYSVENLSDKEKLECMKEILAVISMNRINKGSFDNNTKALRDEFPLRSYLEVMNYFRKYGLYKSTEKYTQEGYNGRINWNKTINRANKILQDKDVMFYPFILNKVRDKDIFISECMDFVLNDALKYKSLITRIINYNSKFNNKLFSNIKYVINHLKQIKSSYFKDSEKKLIDSLIEYFSWKSRLKDNMRMLTLKFENYWENMINVYLNGKFLSVEDDKIMWSDNMEVQNRFGKSGGLSVESKETENRLNRKARMVEYDHFMIKEDVVYIFDSKYYNEVTSLNYKQLFYHYKLKQRHPNSRIINGLLLPTYKEYYTSIHIDRIDLDNVKIVEHYLNLREVISYYQRKM